MLYFKIKLRETAKGVGKISINDMKTMTNVRKNCTNSGFGGF